MAFNFDEIKRFARPFEDDRRKAIKVLPKRIIREKAWGGATIISIENKVFRISPELIKKIPIQAFERPEEYVLYMTKHHKNPDLHLLEDILPIQPDQVNDKKRKFWSSITNTTGGDDLIVIQPKTLEGDKYLVITDSLNNKYRIYTASRNNIDNEVFIYPEKYRILLINLHSINGLYYAITADRI